MRKIYGGRGLSRFGHAIGRRRCRRRQLPGGASRRHHATGRPLGAGTIDPHINYTLQYWQIY